jgi:hypothetical protein
MQRDLENSHHQSWVTRFALGAVAVIGAFLIVIPLATGLPGKSAASGNMMSAFRPQMSDAALAQGTADQQTMAAMGQQLQTAMIPTLATQLKMTPAQLSEYLGTNFPAVGKGMADFAVIQGFFGGVQATMQAQQANFQQADAIPTGYLPPTTMTPLFIIPGAALVLIGAFGLVRPRFTRPLLAAGSVVGLLMAVGLLSVSMAGKASAADNMTTAFQPVFATQNVQQARTYTNEVQAMAVEFTQKALPGLATALQVTPAQLSATLATGFPAVANGVAQLPAIVQRMDTATGLIEANVDNYNQSASIPWSPGSMYTMFWFMMAPALLAVAVGAGGFAWTVRHGTVAGAAPSMRGALHH